jgi:uncharacterized protein
LDYIDGCLWNGIARLQERLSAVLMRARGHVQASGRVRPRWIVGRADESNAIALKRISCFLIQAGKAIISAHTIYFKSMARISIDREKIADFCRKHNISRLSLFGSVLGDDFGPASDVDVLVEFEPGHIPGLAFFSMEEELSRIIGRKVDLNTPGFLSPYFRDRIERESEVQYVLV